MYLLGFLFAQLWNSWNVHQQVGKGKVLFHPSLSYTRPKPIECAYFSPRLPAIFSILSLLTIATLSVLTIGYTFFCLYHGIPTLINWTHVFRVCCRCQSWFPALANGNNFSGALSISYSVLVFLRLPSVTCFPAFSSATWSPAFFSYGFLPTCGLCALVSGYWLLSCPHFMSVRNSRNSSGNRYGACAHLSVQIQEGIWKNSKV